MISAQLRARQLGFDLGLIRFHANAMTPAIQEVLGKSYASHGLEDSEWSDFSLFKEGRELDLAIFNYFYSFTLLQYGPLT
jgi:hypothetical protein